MSDTTLMLGAPSLCGKDARDTLKQTLSGVKFPLVLTVSNRLPFQVSFPAAGRLYLRPSGHDGSTGIATFAEYDEFARFVTDVQAIAELNHAETALELTVPGAPARGKAASGKSDATEG